MYVLRLAFQVRVHDCDDGWLGGQHVRLRVFFSGRVLESHPLTILSAPPSHSCLSNPGMILGSRVNGDWTRALNDYAYKEQERLQALDKTSENVSVPIQVMLDGPYGGSSLDLGRFESALLVAGGSGVTFTLGILDDIVGRCVKLGRRGGERTRRIEFAWCIRSFGECLLML
jgi:NAD(P)H-flavin reductase